MSTATQTTTATLRDGANLKVQATGKGPDLLLVSGLGGTAASWDAMVPRLADRFRVIAFDQRGIGASTRGTEPCTIATLAADCFEVLAHLNSPRALLVGHSTGGVILQAMAAQRVRAGGPGLAEIAGLALSGTWLKPNRFMAELFRSRLAVLKASPREYSAFVAFVGYPPDWLNANWAAYEAILAGAPATPAQQAVVAERIAALLAFDGTADLATLTAPTLIVGAEDDIIVPAFLQRELSAALPQARVAMLESGGHMFPTTVPEAFARILREWADSIAGR